MRPRSLLAVLAAAGLAACGAPTVSSPKVTGVLPGAVATGTQRYVTVVGTGFEPSFAIAPLTGKATADTSFPVTFAGRASPEVTYFGPTTLVARLPSGLAAGTAPVTVTDPDGSQDTLAKGLCVGAIATETRYDLATGATPGKPSQFDLVATPVVGGGRPKVLATDVRFHGIRPLAVSPGGRTLVYLNLTGPAGGQTESLMALHPGSGAPPVVLHAEPAQATDQVMAGLTFTPDGSTVVYVIGGKQLVAQAIPGPGATAAPPKVLATASTDTERLDAPAVDPTGTKVLFGEMSNPPSNGTLVGAKIALYEVLLAGGPPKAILDQRSQGVSNGPGVFLPDGRGILFVSDRVGILAPMKIYNQPMMAPVSNLYRLDPTTGTITPISAPKLEAFVEAPVLSPDGRWAAASGVYDDRTQSAVDLLLTDLSTGEVFRAQVDPSKSTPTIDVDPSFSPDGKTVYATAIHELLVGTNLVPTGVSSYSVALPAKDPSLSPGDRTLPASAVTAIPGTSAAPQVHATYAGCGG